MKFGRINLIAGAVGIFAATFVGFGMGSTLEGNFPQGFYQMPLGRVLARAGHTHGMLFSYFNLIVGLLVDRLSLSDKLKKWLSLLAIGAFLTPLGIFSRGLLGGSHAPEPLAIIGAICYLSSAGLILKGAWEMKAQ